MHGRHRLPHHSFIKRRVEKVRTLNAIDLFAGAGGLSWSLEAAGWQTTAATDFDRDAIETLCLNQRGGRYLRGTSIIHADVHELSGKDLRPSGAPNGWRPDLLAGGPPCQPFSSAGRMLGYEDPRGRLFHQFVRLAAELKPRFVLFENVSGLVTAKGPDGSIGGILKRIQSEFEEIGYACRFELLNAADFGAPQRRVRLYMIASHAERLPSFPVPTHSREKSSDRAEWVSLREFLRSHPKPDPAEVVRPNRRRAGELAKLTPGTGLRSGGIVEANRPSGHWGYRQDCFIADPSVPGRTIRAASTPDWLRERGGHLRRLTWRECAGLQGFPLDWRFAGAAASRFRQIGNAVQGQIGSALAAALYAAARECVSAQPTSAAWPPSFHKRVRYTVMEHEVNGAHRRAAKERVNGALSETLVG